MKVNITLRRLSDVAASRIKKGFRSVNREIKWLSLLAECHYKDGGIFYDDLIEREISNLASKILPRMYNVKAISESKVAFCDSFGLDNRGLTQQYISALIDSELDILYLTQNKKIEKTEIYRELLKYGRSKIVIIQNNNEEKAIEAIFKEIAVFGPSKVFFHLTPWAIDFATVSKMLPSNIEKYCINITDHAYWCGSTTFNYVLEFRDFGGTISYKYRNLKQDQLLLLPYYPYIGEKTFQGWPSVLDNAKVVIFWGGGLSKINAKFLNLIKCILDDNPECVCCSAGTGTPLDIERLSDFINNNNLNSKWFHLGFRQDVNQIMKRCDIYINTYPIGGGLMAQYAAYYSKPIISFGDVGNETRYVEALLRINKQLTYTEKKQFLERVSLLIKNKYLRDEEGRINKEKTIDRNKFLHLFKQTMKENKSILSMDFNNPVTISSTNKEDDILVPRIFQRLGLASWIYFPEMPLCMLSYMCSVDNIRFILNHITKK